MNDNNSTAVKMVEGAANKKGSTASVNRWDDVKDFKWLRREKSPNWDILPEVDAAAFAAWIGEALKTGDEKPFSDADNRWQGWIEMRRKEVRETLPVASRTLEPAVAPPEVTSRDNSGSNGNTNTANEDDSEDEI
ncbi:unnamed protein product [Amoebophrya sp. A25]|nr:unnamed protein product [Amoebophrya sp. A25]|eukprot:GSA25T00022830001.1